MTSKARADDVFRAANEKRVVEGQPDEAAALCRKAIDLNPDHANARMLLGTILGDADDKASIDEAREQFLEVIRRKHGKKEWRKEWREEDPLYHLGVWYARRDKPELSALFLALAAFIGSETGADSARRLCAEQLARVEEVFPSLVNMLLPDGGAP
jgi:tetratricopeptide (TPR) repeat protein